MSRIGKLPIEIPQGVKVNIAEGVISVSGPRGNMSLPLRDEVSVTVEGSTIKVERRDDSRVARSMHGLTRTLIANMVMGVSEGFEKKLEIVGVGYRAELKGDTLVFSLGYSNPVNYRLPEGINAKVDRQTSIVISGYNKQLVGQVAAEIRSLRPPVPYKGKGIRYSDEVIIRKAGKAGKGAGG